MRQPASRRGWKNKADKLWSAHIKNRDKKCQRCIDLYGGREARFTKHPHHIFSRGIAATRHDPLNGIGLCAGHHMEAHIHPEKFTRWLKKHLGEENYNTIYERAYTNNKHEKIDYQAICESLKVE